jgi:hypothetical protein
MAEPSPNPPRGLRSLPGLLAVLLVTATVVGFLVTATPGLHGYDGYFHIRYAEVLRTEGISRSFPWWQETFLRDHWADKDFLYHVLLIPFTIGNLVTGAKVAAVVFASAAMGTVYLVLRALGATLPAAWSVGLLASSTMFVYRLGFTRPLVLAVALALAGTCAILKDNRRWAFACAAIYPHLHISFHLLPCIALVHDLHREVPPGERRSHAVTAWTWAGAAAGALLSPFVPNNLYLWWVQNVGVLRMAWSGPEALRLGAEILPGPSDQLLTYNVGVFFFFMLSIYFLAWRTGRPSPQARTLLVLSMIFLTLTLLSRRFIEFWAPFTALLAAVCVRDATSDLRGLVTRAPRLRWVAAIVLSAAGVLLLARNALAAHEFVRADAGPEYAGSCEWMGANVPPGETIFHLDWDEFPQLFFFDPQLHYLVGLDPTFMYLTDPGRWQLWSDVAHGEAEDLYAPIHETFHSQWVLADSAAEEFHAKARRDPRFFPKFEDEIASVYFLAGGYEFVERWSVTGWYPDPRRRLYDLAIAPEPGAAPGGAAAVGAGAAAVDVASRGGFVDLRRTLTIPPTVTDVCALARSVLVAPREMDAQIGITTDDEVRVWIGGRPGYAHSPFRTPPPGSPGTDPVTLDELIESRSHVEEGLQSAHLRAGDNEVLVKVCQSGKDLGFYLRAFGQDGAPVPSRAP